MTPSRTLQHDPVLAMLPEIRGRRILHPCVLYARLGRGGMGAVYLGKHLTLRQKQVVKCLWVLGGDGDAKFVERFQQEARIAAEMTHQNLVRVTHIDRLGELDYLVMEYIEGEDVDRRVKRKGRLDEASALLLLHGAAMGLGYAHARGIVHRDVKPANLMVSVRGEVKVIDLGLARATHTRQQLAATIGTLGTPLYMAPEQWDNSNVGPTADVWALGASLYWMLAGRSHVPDSIQDPSSLRKFVTECPFPDIDDERLDVGADARRILRRCVARDPAERYPDARALAADLARVVRQDETLLADPDCAPKVDGDEPDDDELLALQRELQQRQTPPPRAPGSSGAARATMQRVDDPTMVFRPNGATTVAPLQTTNATIPQLHVPAPVTPQTAAPAPATAAAPSIPQLPRRASRVPAILAAAAVTAILGGAGVASLFRTDFAAIQKEAMAAIYQERFVDADRLLALLEAEPAFADQARRLRIDALCKEGQRVAGERPLAALVHLATAANVARQLLIPKDTDDALARIQTASAPLAAALRERMAAAVTVTEPQPGATIVRNRQPVLVNVAAGDLQLVVRVDDQTLQPEPTPGQRRAEWNVPECSGEAQLRLVVEEATTLVQHVVTVPVVIKRGAVALQVEAPTQPASADSLALTGSVHNGPVAVRCRFVRPDGSRGEQDLGTHDGTFPFTLPCAPEMDGEYRVQLHTTLGGQDLASVERTLVVDRRPPELHFDGNGLRTATKLFVLRGTASEPCRVFVRGHEDRAVPTDPSLAFTLPLALPTADGPVVFALEARDAAGNTTPEALALELVVDRKAPSFVPESLVCAARTAAASVTITGRLDEPGLVEVGDGEPMATGADGTFTVEAPLPAGAIEQTVALRLVGRDLAQNPTPPLVRNLVVDRTGPAILPAAPDGSWWADGRWMLKIEDTSGPCRVTLGGETRETGTDGRVEFPLRSSASAIEVAAEDGLGNRSQRSLASPRIGDDRAEKPAPGPAWATPVEGSTVDPAANLFERVSIPIGKQRLVLRLVRPLVDADLPPPAHRDAQAVAILANAPPFYLAETEVTAALWAEFAAVEPDAGTSRPRRVFDPRTCQWTVRDDASWQVPLHPDLFVGADAAERARWPITMVTPDDAKAFCRHFGLRLPHEREWWFAARMGTRHRYGWGNGTTIEDRANLADLSLLAKAPRLQAFETIDDGFAGLAPADTFPRRTQEHPWGFRGLLGNAAEWCTTRGDRVVARGGSWLSEPRELRVDELRQDGLVTSGAWDHVGFRVVRDL